MFYRLLPLLCAFITLTPFFIEAKEKSNSCSLDIMPCPHHVNLGKGSYLVKPTLRVYISGMSRQRKLFAVEHFGKQLKRVADFSKLEVVAKKDTADLVINLSKSNLDQQSLFRDYQYPKLGDDESYQLVITNAQILIQSTTDFGAMHGLTTLVQLISNEANKQSQNNEVNALLLPQLKIIDKPRFKWRGLLIDSVRHFIPIDDIKRQLDGMAAAKLNVFHWHLTDDQGWRVESKSYPKLQHLSADSLFYSQKQIIDLVSYASLLGIRVVPEFDIPGHASAIAVAYPELIADKKTYQQERRWGVFKPLLDVSDDRVFQFVETIIKEFTGLFPDVYFHIGGDEVDPEQWLNNPKIKQLMGEEKLVDGNDIQRLFNSKLQVILSKYHRKMVGWDEIYHPDLPKDIVVQSWRGLESLHKMANDGYQGVLSTGFYIDQPQYSAYHYRNDPILATERVEISASNKQSTTIKLSNNEIAGTWLLTIPRLKGADVKGQFILMSKSVGSDIAELVGYLKLNNNDHKKVVITKHSIVLNEEKASVQPLVFEMDSWMGPLRFELDLRFGSYEKTAHIYSQVKQQKSSEKTKHHNKLINRVFIGNAYYPLIAEQVSNPLSTEISISKKLAWQNKDNILGGEAALWTELVSKANIDLRTWPRLFVIAERLWSKQSINDVSSMYQRLVIIDKYADQTIGLLHKAQQKMGLFKLIANSEYLANKEYLTATKYDTELAALMDFSQIFEPAHYYTRHHLKYQQNLYHQLAPLDGFADFLPVESFQLIDLDMLVKSYQLGNDSALLKIINKLSHWQDSSTKVEHLFNHNSDLSLALKNFKNFHQLILPALHKCRQKLAYNKIQKEQIVTALRKLQSQQNETVLAIIPLFEVLISSCQIHN